MTPSRAGRGRRAAGGGRRRRFGRLLAALLVGLGGLGGLWAGLRGHWVPWAGPRTVLQPALERAPATPAGAPAADPVDPAPGSAAAAAPVPAAPAAAAGPPVPAEAPRPRAEAAPAGPGPRAAAAAVPSAAATCRRPAAPVLVLGGVLPAVPPQPPRRGRAPAEVDGAPPPARPVRLVPRPGQTHAALRAVPLAPAALRPHGVHLGQGEIRPAPVGPAPPGLGVVRVQVPRHGPAAQPVVAEGTEAVVTGSAGPDAAAQEGGAAGARPVAPVLRVVVVRPGPPARRGRVHGVRVALPPALEAAAPGRPGQGVAPGLAGVEGRVTPGERVEVVPVDVAEVA